MPTTLFSGKAKQKEDVTKIPAIFVDGKTEFISIIPKNDEFVGVLKKTCLKKSIDI